MKKAIYGKTWRLFPISPVSRSAFEAKFVDKMVTSLRQYFVDHAMVLGNSELQSIIVQEIDSVSGLVLSFPLR